MGKHSAGNTWQEPDPTGRDQQNVLGPGDDGTTQSVPRFEAGEQSYTSREADSLFRSGLPRRAERKNREEQQLDRGYDDTSLEATQAMPPVRNEQPPLSPSPIVDPMTQTQRQSVMNRANSEYGEQASYPSSYNPHNNAVPVQAVPPAHNLPPAQNLPPVDTSPDNDEEPHSYTALIVSIVIILLLIGGLVAFLLLKSSAAPETDVKETQTTQTTPETPSQTTTQESEETQPKQSEQQPTPTQTKTVTQTVPPKQQPGKAPNNPKGNQPAPEQPSVPADGDDPKQDDSQGGGDTGDAQGGN